MKNLRWIIFALLVLAGCGGEADSALEDAAARSTSSQAPATTEAPVVADIEDPAVDAPAADEPVLEDAQQDTAPPAALAFAEPVRADDSEVDLRDDVPFDIEVYQLVADPGTEWELPLFVPAPAGWAFDAELGGFTDGNSSISLTTGCIGPCQPVAWSAVLSSEGNFLEPPQGASSFGSGFNQNGNYSSVASSNDDGTGLARVAHFRNEGARFLGCSATVESGPTDVDDLRTLCESIAADWTTVLANSPEATIEENVTESASDSIANPNAEGSTQIVPVDSLEPEHTVTITLPEQATHSTDFFGAEVSLGRDWSIFSDLSLNRTCDGICGAQDWEQKLNSSDGVLSRNRAGLTVDNDTPIESGWLLSGAPVGDEDEYAVVVVLWDNNADAYFICEADLDEDDAHRADEAIAICLSAEPSWLGAQ